MLSGQTRSTHCGLSAAFQALGVLLCPTSLCLGPIQPAARSACPGVCVCVCVCAQVCACLSVWAGTGNWKLELGATTQPTFRP